jgi:hypothetical protein
VSPVRNGELPVLTLAVGLSLLPVAVGRWRRRRSRTAQATFTCTA